MDDVRGCVRRHMVPLVPFSNDGAQNYGAPIPFAVIGVLATRARS
ncbi:hypothetical protein AB7M63_005249 [Bradyrhizobium japonicum]